ncbi:L-histidine N(alpha)-methyltransferase [Mucilaginibacter gossypii]|uniref:Dimethylhistidine N-methyltransferase n=1 Tax=Mucilaginibacter gossypii TaxID=551996 RepID=A0A1G8F095_9SPHI|nr:L-histidine N(alpha)-methyltransferase [Mucilaginibacter gossypii]SDH75561.1 dimethylhistidine N-methyltransferase [Mucilaginibacter gossypii]
MKTNLSDLPEIGVSSLFEQDVLDGLMQMPKRLQSKYFYDETGDILFQQIMACPEYYLTNCELEVFSKQSSALAERICRPGQSFDLIELGAGDATKSEYLLDFLVRSNVDFKYLPIDISDNILQELKARFNKSLPQLVVQPLAGEYFEMLKVATQESANRKVIFFLGANIGNMDKDQAIDFCHTLRSNLSPGDLLLIGFDLKKHPRIILNAYDDQGKITSKFNLNLLARINRELDSDFDLERFEHYQTYDPETGASKSYLVSLQEQHISIKGQIVAFAINETIYMEVSQKYSIEEIAVIAQRCGFRAGGYWIDSKGWFADVCWEVV